MSMKNCSETIGNRTRDLPACSAVPQPTAPSNAPNKKWLNVNMRNISIGYNLELGQPRCVCNIRCRKGIQTQQCILTYISVELHVSAYIEAIIRFNIAS